MSDISLIEQEIIQALRPNLLELNNIWEYIGYAVDERSARLQETTNKLRKYFDEILVHENSVRLDTEHRIECRRREVADLCMQLRLPSFFPDRGLPARDLMNVLDQKFDELDRLRRFRCDEYMRLRSRILRLSQLLNETPDSSLSRVSNFPPLLPQEPASPNNSSSSSPARTVDKVHSLPVFDRIPDERDLKRLAEIHDELDALYTPLATQYTALCEDIARIAAEVAYGPQSERESELLKVIGLSRLCESTAGSCTPGVVRRVSDSEAHDIHNANQTELDNGHDLPVVNEETLQWLTEFRLKLVKEKARLVGTCEELRAYLTSMWGRLDKPIEEREQFLSQHGGYRPETLEALQEEVDRCQQLKWENLNAYVSRLTDEATKLARTCCLDETVIQPPGLDFSDPEVFANHLETVLEQLNRTFALYKPIFERIAVYEEQWQALLDVELRLKDPSIFSNRGGILLKTEREKKRLVREVQRAEQDVTAAIEQHELKTKSEFRLPDGRTFRDYVAERCPDSKPSREPSRVRRSVVCSSNSRPHSANLSVPPGAPS